MEIKDIKAWFEVAIPEPTIEQACIQIGCHYEEVSEMAVTLADFQVNEELDRIAAEYKRVNYHYLSTLDDMGSDSKAKLLDDLCDQIVTTIGVAHMLGMDIEGALAEVNRSNHSKFEFGKPVFNEQGKISKGKYYTAPDLAKFVGGE